MKPFVRTTGRVAVLDRPDVDTDQIIPKQFLKRIERTGWADGLFFDWRKDPDFELNNPAYAGAKILLAGRNFGCGSSREHAPWALQESGYEVIVALVVRGHLRLELRQDRDSSRRPARRRRCRRSWISSTGSRARR